MNLKVSSNEILIFCIRTEVFFSQQLGTNMPSVGILYLSKRGKSNIWSTCFRESLKFCWTPQKSWPLLYHRFPLRPYNQPLVSLGVRSWGRLTPRPSVISRCPGRLKLSQNDVPRPKRVQVRLWRLKFQPSKKNQSTGQCWWFFESSRMTPDDEIWAPYWISSHIWVVIFSFRPYLGKWSHFDEHIFQRGWWKTTNSICFFSSPLQHNQLMEVSTETTSLEAATALRVELRSGPRQGFLGWANPFIWGNGWVWFL